MATANDLPGYEAAMDWLYNHKPHMAKYVGSLGTPRQSPDCPRAMVVGSPELRPVLYANDEFLQEIGPAQAAGALAHEFRHVLMGHLGEVFSPKPEWRYPVVLRDVHEATINDNLEYTGYELPDDVIRGSNRSGHFYGYWTTDEAYGPMEEWYLSQQPPKEPQQGEDSSEPSEAAGDSSETSSSGGGSSQGASSNQDSGNASNSSSSSGSSEEDSPEDGEEKAEQGSSSSTADSSDQTGSDRDSAGGEACQTGEGYMEDGTGGLRKMTDEELKDFKDELKKAVINAVKQAPMPKNERPTEEELDGMDQEIAEAVDPSRAGSYSKGQAGSGHEIQEVLRGGKLTMGWLKILQKINPEVGKESGGLQARASYDWARPRRTTSLVRGAMLPSFGAPRADGFGVGHKPEVLVALDHSGSIPPSMQTVLRELARSIPEDKISVHCVTFSTFAVEFDFKAESSMVASGGTDFSCVEREARKIMERTGKYPAVICLTDGQASFNSVAPTTQQLDASWIWVDIESERDEDAFRHSSGGYGGYGIYGPAFSCRDQKNKIALPYDRSKLPAASPQSPW